MKKLSFFKNLKEETGSVLVLVAAAMVALLGLSAIVIDGGRLYYEKSKLQKAVDAAVLAGAPHVLNQSTDVVKEVVKKYIKNNGMSDFSLTDFQITHDKNRLHVEAQTGVALTFARVIGFSNQDVRAAATVELSALVSHKGKGLIPLGINVTKFEDFEKEEELTLKFEDFDSSKDPGWFGPLLFEPVEYLEEEKEEGEAGQFRAAIRTGSKYPIKVGDILEVADGVKHGPTIQGFKGKGNELNGLFGTCTDDPDWIEDVEDVNQYLEDTENTDCHNRLVIVPVYEPHTYENTEKDKKVIDVEVLGFATIFITEVQEKGEKATVRGVFMDYAVSGEGSKNVPEYGAYTFRLIE
ncbi:MAG: hypothetical protein H0Z33_10020 [Bacillaceae bacterium]|nr:hypothetical protein [Bacillaceae bacterium]